MMFGKSKIEVVKPREYSREETLAYLGGRSVCEKKAPITESINLIPLFAMAAPLFNVTSASAAAPVTGEWAVQTAPTVATIPTGLIADKSLEMLATMLDPVIQILVAISFPIASVIMIGACFFFMFGNSDKAWSMILNAGLGYVLIQISPLFLEILRTVGEAVA